MNIKTGIVISFFILLSIILVPEYAFAQLEKPSYHVGDYWDYKISASMPSEDVPIVFWGTAHMEIMEKTKINVDISNYEVWKIISRFELTSDSYNMTLTEYTTSYWRISDGATVKSITDKEISSIFGSEVSHTETTHRVIQPDLAFPVDVGDSWERHEQNKVEDETGAEIEMIDTYYECIDTTDITTEAGSYPCYVIKSMEDVAVSDTYEMRYYSNKVGNIVKTISYENGMQTMVMTLESYSYSGEKAGNGGTPGFEPVLVVIAFISLIMILRKKR